MSGEVRSDIPATAVPRYPVLRLTWHTDGSLTLGNDAVQIPEGQDPRIAGLNACAAHARDRGGDPPVIRVLAHDEESDATWHMGVTGDGDIIVLENEALDGDADAPQKVSRRALLGIAAGGGAVLLAGGAIGTAALIRSSQKKPAPTASPRPPGNGDLVPVAVPEGYSPTALWSVSVAANTVVEQLRDGRTLTVAPDSNNLRLHDAKTGRVEWTGTGHANTAHVAETVIDGRPFLLALDTAGALNLWPLDEGTTSAVTSLELPAREGVLHVTGPAPAVALPTQTGYIFQGADSVSFDIPVGYTLIGATAEGQGVLLGERGWALLTPGETAVSPTELLLPSPDYRIAGGFLLGEDRLLVRQDGPTESQWALYATDSSNALLTAPASGGQMPSPADVVANSDRTLWALPGLVATATSITPVDDLTVTSVTDLGVYGKASSGQVLVRPGEADPTALPADVTAPGIADDEHAVLIADKLDTPTAYTVRRTA